MQLIQIGQVVLNLDLVTMIRDFSGRDDSFIRPGPLRIEFTAGPAVEILQDADLLRQWLATHSTVLRPPA